MRLQVKNGETILCIGDSITDCGRRAGDHVPIGAGYVRMLRDMLVADYPERKIEVVNRGIGGNTMADLQIRWEDDVTAYRPRWLTILVGINDLSRTIRGVPGYAEHSDWALHTPDKYAARLDEVLTRTERTIGARVILMEPFYLSTDTTDGFRGMILRRIEEYRVAVRAQSRKHRTGLVRLHEIFAGHLKRRPCETFCAEPVHPNPGGHMVIARALYKALHEKPHR